MVMMAKQTFVWLDQLSRTYGRDIRRLDQIPDEELDTLIKATIAGGGVIPHIHKSLINKSSKKSD